MITSLPDVVPADIAGALDELGIQYRVRGDEAVGLCPSPEHDDTSPSWSVNLDTGKHHCFSCGFGGSFQWLVQIVKGARAGEAVAWIKTRRMRIGTERAVTSPEPVVQESDLWMTVAPPDWARTEREVTAYSCQALEVLWVPEESRWIFPLRDPWTDKLIGWQSKGTGADSDYVDNYPRRVKKSSTVFGYKHLKLTGTDGPVVVVENPVKAAKFHSAGIIRAVATMGASFVDYQVNDLLWPVADTVVFALDNDKAAHGRLAKYIVQNPYARQQVRIFNYGNVQKKNGAFVHYMDDRDPGDLSYDALRWGVENATPAYRSYFHGVDWS